MAFRIFVWALLAINLLCFFIQLAEKDWAFVAVAAVGLVANVLTLKKIS